MKSSQRERYHSQWSYTWLGLGLICALFTWGFATGKEGGSVAVAFGIAACICLVFALTHDKLEVDCTPGEDCGADHKRFL